MNETAFGHQFGIAVAIVSAIEYFKRAGWFKGMSIDSTKINVAVSFFSAFIAAVSITITISGNSASGWHGSFSIPPLATVLDGASHFFTQVGLQVFAYHNGLKQAMDVFMPISPTAPGPIAGAGDPAGGIVKGGEAKG